MLYGEDGAVKGVVTQDMGIAKDGSHKPDYTPGIELHAKYTLFAEGARGHLTKRLKAKFAPRARLRAADLRARDQGIVGRRAGASTCPAG